jgi:hypothetical protein
MSDNPVEDLIAALCASANNSAVEAPTFVSQYAALLPLVFQEVDAGIDVFEEVAERYLPTLKAYSEAISDYQLDRKIAAINRLRNETGLDAGQAANFVMQLAEAQSKFLSKLEVANKSK